MVKLVAVARSGNEIDIIEAFVQHHCRIFDLLILIDDHSADGTAEVLDRMKAAGYPIIVYKARDVPWSQQHFVSILMRTAAITHAATWVAPIDVDEFVEVAEGFTLPGLLSAYPDNVFEIRWSNFVWSRSDGNGGETNPVVRMRHRLPSRKDNAKVIVPGALLRQDLNAHLSPGNHQLVVTGGDFAPLVFEPRMTLCHYPIRSVEQFTSKTVINYLRSSDVNGVRGDEENRRSFHYERPFEVVSGKIAPGPDKDIEAEMERMSRAYALKEDAPLQDESREAPLRYLGGPLTYTDRPVNALRNITVYAKRLAQRLAALEADRG